MTNNKLHFQTTGARTGKDLLKLKLTDATVQEGTDAALTGLLQQLTAIWRELLHKDYVGVNDDFFRISGNSIKAVQLVSRILKVFNVRVTLTEIFEHATVGRLALLIGRRRPDPQRGLIILSPDPSLLHHAFPLTLLQQAYWVGRASLFELGDTATHIYTEDDVAALDMIRFNNAMRKVLGRHAMMRVVVERNGEQRIREAEDIFTCRVYDLRQSDQAGREKILEAIRQEMAYRRLNLTEAAYDIRVSLLSGETSRIHFCIDMIMADAQSMLLLQRDFWSFYNNDSYDPVPLNISFRDYVLAEAEIKQTDFYARSAAYWMERINHLPPRPELPLTTAIVGEQTYVSHVATLPSPLWSRIKAAAADRGLTPNAILLTLYAEVLAVWSNSKEFTVNLTTSGRMPLHEQVNELVGEFTSITLLAVAVLENETWSEKARRLQQQLWADLEHSYFSGIEVIRELSRRNNSGERAIMPVIFTSTLALDDNVPAGNGEDPSIRRVFTYTPTSQAWLDHQVSESGGTLHFSWTVADSLFPQGMAETMFDTYCNLLNELAENENAWESSRQLLLPQRQMMEALTTKAVKAHYPYCRLEALFDASFNTRPDQIAVVSGDRNVTYRELKCRADSVCRSLLKRHSAPNKLVGVWMEKSIEQIIAVVGIVKAGAAYLPLDPAWPPERISYLLNSTATSVVITDAITRNKTDKSHISRDVSLLDIAAILQDNSATGAAPVFSPDDLAYVMFTSGSTGTPKGVMMTHKAVVNTLLDINSRFGVGETDKVLGISGLSFDLSVYDIFGTLAAGATLVLPRAAPYPMPTEWGWLIRTAQITIWNSVPALMDLVLTASGREKKASLLRLVLLSGDWIPLSLPREIENIHSKATVISLGGATEAAIWSVIYPIQEINESWKNIPYGDAMTNQRLYVLNEWNEHCPAWVPGDIYIAGAGLAEGYWGDNAQTARQFTVDAATGDKRYRTGDRGRYFPDGTIDFLGRTDFQVKINGFRIEPGEIEVALLSSPLVKEAVVAVKKMNGNDQLVAYLIPKDGGHRVIDASGGTALTSQNIRDLQELLRHKLPGYMVPSWIVELPALPLTTNGKVDRNALPLPVVRETAALPEDGTDFNIEKNLMSVFSKVLDKELNDPFINFFDAGGNSLLAMRAITFIHQVFHVEIDFRTFLSAPTISDIGKFIRAAGKNKYRQIPVAPAQARCEVTAAQRRLWLLEHFEGGSASYNLQETYTLYGQPDIGILDHSFRDLVNRHEILRTVFVSDQGKVWQQVKDAESMPAAIRCVDLRAMNDPVPELEAITNREVSQPMDLQQGPLFRVCIVRLEEQKYVLSFVIHHIIADGWSMWVIIREVLKNYEQLIQGKALPVRSPGIQYKDYATWKNQREEEFQQHHAYWMEQFRDGVPIIDLPTDFPRPRMKSYRGRKISLVVDKEITEKLSELGKRNTASTFMLIMAATKLLLFRYTGQTDLVVGFPVAGRDQAELEDQIGLYVNILLSRTRIAGDKGFNELIRTVKEQILEAYKYQQCSFEKLVEDLAIKFDPGRSPLFDVMVVLQNFGNDQLPTAAATGLKLEDFETQETVSRYDLTFNFIETAGLSLVLEYNTDLFSAHTAAQMLERFSALLRDAVLHPSLPLTKLAFLSPEAQQIILEEFNPKMPDEGFELGTIQEVFREQVRKMPDAVAVTEKEMHITYRELDVLSDAIAAYLREVKGFKKGQQAGVMMQRSSGMVVTIMGILKAGGVCVPIDPAYPEKRKSYMLSHAAIPWLLTDRVRTLPEGYKGEEICFADIPLAEWKYLGDVPAGLTGSDLAYIIFTSGSTGIPKGVMLEHKGILNHTNAKMTACRLHSGSVVAQNSSHCFVASIWQFLSVLFAGGRMVIYSTNEQLDHQNFMLSLHRDKVSVLQLVPSYLEQVLSMASQQSARKFQLPLDYLLVTGEVIKRSVLKRWHATFPGIPVMNTYGMSEASDDVSHYLFPFTETDLDILIGKPLENTNIFVLDEDMQLCPVGIPGQICVAGAGIARGYINNPESTGKSFVAWQSGRKEVLRLYKTGDMGKWMPDGNIAFLGRKDMQVKIRGNRVEAGEIEEVLLLHGEITSAAVLPVKTTQEDFRLIAYYSAPVHITPVAAQHWLRQYLPEYMIPPVLIRLDALPVNSSGKADRSLLAAMALSPEEGGRENYHAPESRTESDLCGIWEEILPKKGISTKDDFFLLGGSSFGIMRVVNAVRNHFGIALPLQEVVSCCTISQMASLIDARKSSTDALIPSVSPDKEKQWDPFPLNVIQQAYWIGRSGAFELGNISTHLYLEYAFPDFDEARFHQAAEMLIMRHDMLRMVIQDDGWQRIIPYAQAEPQIRTTDFRTNSAAQIADALQAIRSAGTKGQPEHNKWLYDIRISLLPGNMAHVHFIIDLLIADAWSIGILQRDFSRLYANPALELPPVHFSFRDYVLAVETFRGSTTYERSKEYWKKRLVQLPPAPQLPVAIPAGEIKDPAYTSYIHTLVAGEWKMLKQLAAGHGITPTVLLLSVFAEVLARWSKDPSFTINLTLFNRLPFHEAVNDVVGDFTSVNLSAISFDENDSFSARARKLQAQTWLDLEHRYYSGVEVIRDLAAMKGGSSKALMPVVFTSMLSLYDTDAELNPPSKERLVYNFSATSQVWLDHQVFEQHGELITSWTVVNELFPEGMIQNLFDCYSATLKMLLYKENWQTRLVPPVPLLPADAVSVHAPSTERLDTLFEQAVLQYPDNIAIHHNGKNITYDRLSLYANKVCNWLLKAGARAGDLVGVYMEKGWEQVAAVLGILKAGCAYMPMGVSVPEERTKLLLELTAVTKLLVQDIPEQAWLLRWSGDILCMKGPQFENLDETYCTSASRSENLAYVIFTSGSTGVPKGVMIDHQGAVNTILDINSRITLSAKDKVLAVSSLGFDLSVYDIFGSLAAGATIVVPDALSGPNPHHWMELISSQQVTVWNSVPALMDLLVGYTGSERREKAAPLASLRTILLSGDWIPLDLPGKIWGECASAAVISLGGATEASIWSVIYPVAAIAGSWTSIPYGKALAHQEMSVLNSFMEECPAYVTGQIHIGGIGLAKGYWKDAEKTAQHFVTHKTTGRRLYRTGDLGRYLPDGNIELLGRMDFQVKINGYRIEPGEIEAVLRQHPQVKDAVVVATGSDIRDKQLCAFIVAKELPGDLQDMAAPAQPPVTINNTVKKLPANPDGYAVAANSGLITENKRLQLDEDTFSRWIGALSQLQPEGSPLPKYLYPSAGSLYPVQTYCYISNNFSTGIPSGLYYYNPAKHGLVAVRKADDPAFPKTSFSKYDFLLWLVAEMDAVAPMYGNIAEDFCLLEAGYMAQLLYEKAEEAALCLPAAPALNTGVVRELLRLSSHQVLTCTLGTSCGGENGSPKQWHAVAAEDPTMKLYLKNPLPLIRDKAARTVFKLDQNGIRKDSGSEQFFPLSQLAASEQRTGEFLRRQSYRVFNTVAVKQEALGTLLRALQAPECNKQFVFGNFQHNSQLRYFIYLKENAVTGLEKGLYAYIPEDHSLLPITGENVMSASLHHADNRELLQEAIFSLYICSPALTGRKPSEENARESLLLWSGAIGQRLMQIGPTVNIGLCPLGNMNMTRISEIFSGENEPISLLHAFAGGAIDSYKQQHWKPFSGTNNDDLTPALTTYLKNKLPHYLVPARLIELEALPTTPNGKTDRNALIASASPVRIVQKNEMPVSRLESELKRIWEEVLDSSGISANDNFFELGGNSLHAIQMIARVHRELGIKLTLRNVLEYPEVRKLAVCMENIPKTSYESIGFLPHATQKHYDLSHPQKRLWILDQFAEKRMAYSIHSVYSVVGDLDYQSLRQAVHGLIIRHEILRTVFVKTDNGPRQVIGVDCNVDHYMEYIDLINEKNVQDRIEKIASGIAQKPFDLASGPLLRVCVIRKSHHEYVVISRIHHIIADGWSMQILWHELMILYAAFTNGNDHPLPPLKIQYRDYTKWHNRSLASGKDRNYWLQCLKGSAELVNFAFDYSESRTDGFNGKKATLEITKGHSQNLKKIALRNNTTYSTVLLSVFKLLLQQLTGQQEITVALTAANRAHPDLEGLIGFFSNLLLIRTEFYGTTTFNELLEKVNNNVSEAMEHQDYPFDLLVEELNPERYSNGQPMFNVAFTCHNQESIKLPVRKMGSDHPDGLLVQEISLREEYFTAKFDLLLFVSESENDTLLTFEYNANLFKEDTIKRYLKYFSNLVVAISNSGK